VSSALPDIEHARYELRRVVQTRRTFSNWPTLLRGMTGERFGRGTGELEFVTRTGIRLSCPNVPGARLPIYEQFADDSYRLRDFLAPLQGRPIQVLDVGAHIGSFSINLTALHPQSRIECYEPSPQSFEYLRRNIDQNGLGARLVAHEAALAATEGTALFDDNDGASVHNGLMQSDQRLVAGQDAIAQRHALEVRTGTFDGAVAAAPAPFDVVKMDCEGGEYSLVYASSKRNWESVSRVVMEYHPVEGETWDELRGWLESTGLKVYKHESLAPGLGTAWLAR
jgi:FkbM family methyltransferase